jgi:hypothetical protein
MESRKYFGRDHRIVTKNCNKYLVSITTKLKDLLGLTLKWQ